MRSFFLQPLRNAALKKERLNVYYDNMVLRSFEYLQTMGQEITGTFFAIPLTILCTNSTIYKVIMIHLLLPSKVANQFFKARAFAFAPL